MSSIAIKGGTVHPVTSGSIKNGEIMLEGSRIASVGSGATVPEGAEVIDAGGLEIYPGFIDAHTHLGVTGLGEGWESRDANEVVSPVIPHVRALDGYNPADRAIRTAMESGITAAMVAPGSSNVVGGEAFVIKTAPARSVEEAALSACCGIKMAFGENPKRNYQARKMSPYTRMGAAAVLREAFCEALNFREKQKKEDAPRLRDLKAENLLRLLDGEIPARTHAHRADDILTALRIRREFGFDMVLEHGSEGHLVAGEIKEAGVPVVAGPLLGPGMKRETSHRDFDLVRMLDEAGITVALTTDHPASMIQLLPVTAALCMRTGVPRERVLRMVTVNAAEICGVAGRIGSIETGKDADIVIYDGDPFEISTRVVMVLINGRLVYDARGGESEASRVAESGPLSAGDTGPPCVGDSEPAGGNDSGASGHGEGEDG